MALIGRLLAHRGACYGFSRMRGQAPRAFGAAPRSGAITWLLERGCFALWSFEICNGLHEGAHANLTAQILARSPPVLGGSAAGTGGMPHALQNPQQATLRAKNRAPNAKSAPLLRRSRNTGGPRTNESEGRGGRRAGDAMQKKRHIRFACRVPLTAWRGSWAFRCVLPVSEERAAITLRVVNCYANSSNGRDDAIHIVG